MNPHHLELFYYVARHGGISRAARAMPYGIQQPAISGQILKLEQELHTRLFERLPFRLTLHGNRLYQHIRGFFDGLESIAREITAPDTPLLRVGASQLVVAHYMPEIAETVRKRAGRDIRFAFQTGTASDLIAAGQNGTLDVIVTAVDRPPPTMQATVVRQLPLVLLQSNKEPVVRLPALLATGRARPQLIEPVGVVPLCRRFEEGLQARGVAWGPTMTVSTIELVPWFVAQGHGIGLCLDLPLLTRQRGVRRVPLPEFGTVNIMTLACPPVTPLKTALVAAIAESDGMERAARVPVPAGSETN